MILLFLMQNVRLIVPYVKMGRHVNVVTQTRLGMAPARRVKVNQMSCSLSLKQ